jgi:hypothetical protein
MRRILSSFAALRRLRMTVGNCLRGFMCKAAYDQEEAV